MSERPRVLLLSPLPPPVGGISNWTACVLASHLSLRFEMRTTNTAPSQPSAVSGQSRPTVSRALDMPRMLFRFAVDLARFRPDVVHVNTSFFWGFVRDGVAVWFASLAGARVVLHLHGGDFPEWVERLGRPLGSLVLATLRRASRVVAITRPTERWLHSKLGHERVAYLPNFAQLGPEPPGRDASKAFVDVLFVGWRIEAKGIRELLEAAQPLGTVRVTLIGPEEPAFVESLSQLLQSLGARARMEGAKPRGEVERAMRTADIFVLPSWREGFPIVVPEAMAAGLPVVATAVGAIPEIVEPEVTGLLVAPRDVEGLRSALLRLVRDAELRLRMGGAGRRHVAANFSQEAVLDRLARCWLEANGPHR